MGRYTDLFKDITNEVKTKNDTILLIDGMNTFLRSFTMINHIIFEFNTIIYIFCF